MVGFVVAFLDAFDLLVPGQFPDRGHQLFLVDLIRYKKDMMIDEWLFTQNVWFEWFAVIVLIVAIYAFGEYGSSPPWNMHIGGVLESNLKTESS